MKTLVEGAEVKIGLRPFQRGLSAWEESRISDTRLSFKDILGIKG